MSQAQTEIGEILMFGFEDPQFVKDLIGEDRLAEASAKLQRLMDKERVDELEKLYDPNNGIMASHYIYLTDGAADEINEHLRARLKALSHIQEPR